MLNFEDVYQIIDKYYRKNSVDFMNAKTNDEKRKYNYADSMLCDIKMDLIQLSIRNIAEDL